MRPLRHFRVVEITRAGCRTSSATAAVAQACHKAPAAFDPPGGSSGPMRTLHLEENAEGDRELDVGRKRGEESVHGQCLGMHAGRSRAPIARLRSPSSTRWRARYLSSSAPQCSPRQYFQARRHHENNHSPQCSSVQGKFCLESFRLHAAKWWERH